MGCASGAGIIVPHAGCPPPPAWSRAGYGETRRSRGSRRRRDQSAKCECVTLSCVTRNQCRRKRLMRVQRLLFVTGSAWVVSGVAVVMLAARPHAQQPAAAPPPPVTHRSRRRPAAQSERRRDRGGPQEHDGAARHQGAASGAERQRAGAEPRQLRRGEGQSVSRTCPTSLTLKNGKKVTTADDVVEAAAAGDRRGLRARSARPRAEERAEGDVDGQPHRARSTVGGRPVVGKELVGHVDNSAYPGRSPSTSR